MKKFISVILLLTLCLGLFAGCEKKPAETQPPVDNLAAAKSYLFNMYKGTAGKGEANKAVKDFNAYGIEAWEKAINDQIQAKRDKLAG